MPRVRLRLAVAVRLRLTVPIRLRVAIAVRLPRTVPDRLRVTVAVLFSFAVAVRLPTVVVHDFHPTPTSRLVDCTLVRYDVRDPLGPAPGTLLHRAVPGTVVIVRDGAVVPMLLSRRLLHAVGRATSVRAARSGRHTTAVVAYHR